VRQETRQLVASRRQHLASRQRSSFRSRTTPWPPSSASAPSAGCSSSARRPRARLPAIPRPPAEGEFFIIDGTFITGTRDFYPRIKQVFDAARQNAPPIIFTLLDGRNPSVPCDRDDDGHGRGRLAARAGPQRPHRAVAVACGSPNATLLAASSRWWCRSASSALRLATYQQLVRWIPMRAHDRRWLIPNCSTTNPTGR